MAYSLQDFLDLFEQQGGATPTTQASVSKSRLSGLPGVGSLLSSIPGLGGGGTQGGVEGGINTGLQAAAMIPGPQQPFVEIATLLAPFIESFFGGGVPREAKSASIGSALSATGNPLAELMGQFITKNVGQGHVLSESGNQTFGQAVERIGAMLAALTGQRLPTVTGTGPFEHNPTQSFRPVGAAGNQFQLPAGYQFATDPSKYSQLFSDVTGAVGNEAAVSPKQAQSEWQRVLQELISQGILQKYQGSLGPVHGGSAATGGSGGSPNIALPHPLNPNPSKFPVAPYQPLAA